MKRQPRILAGTALGLLMASAPLGAYPLQGNAAFGLAQRTSAPFTLAQAACAEGESAEACAQKQPKQRERKKAEPEQQAAPAAQGEQPAEQEQPRKKREKQQQTESAPADALIQAFHANRPFLSTGLIAAA